jgi:prepilin-type N-terminal cleavage/methylation domain-containing protein
MKNNKRKAFTLVEIMIVILIIGILLAIAVPNFVKARRNSRLQSIVANLKQIEDAKEQCAMDLGLGNGSIVCTPAVLTDAENGYMKVWPTGPVVGDYVENAIGTAPTFIAKDIAAWKADHSTL